MALVNVEYNHRIAIITLNNPPMNVLSIDLATQLDEAVDAISERGDIIALIITGAGERAFMAGADIKEFPRYIDEGIAEEMALNFDLLMTKLQRLPIPTIAALNGITLGGGCELALACDFRIAEEQVQIGLPEIKLGVFPGAGGTQRLPRLIGMSRAKELIFTGEPIGALQAKEYGLVTRVVPEGEGLQAALDFAGIFRNRSRVSLGMAKQAIEEGMELNLERGLTLEARLFGKVFDTHDAKEGIEAFMAKRKPKFEDR